MPYSIVDLKTTEDQTWLAIVMRNYQYRPLWWVPGVTPDAQSALLQHSCQTALADESQGILACFEDDVIVGIATLRYMAWDSAHYGVAVYRLDLFSVWGNADRLAEARLALITGAMDWARTRGGRTIHTWLPMEEIRAIQILESVNFRMMDVLVTWAFDHTQNPVPKYSRKCAIRAMRPTDLDVFIPLARDAFVRTPDRFHADPRLSSERSNALYAEWARNSFSGEMADYTLVAEVDGRPAGFTSLKTDDHHGLSNLKTGMYTLAAVSDWALGHGLYTSMIHAAMEWMVENRVSVSHLGTQVNNYAVERAWVRLGFKVHKAGPSLHLWLGA